MGIRNQRKQITKEQAEGLISWCPRKSIGPVAAAIASTMFDCEINGKIKRGILWLKMWQGSQQYADDVVAFLSSLMTEDEGVVFDRIVVNVSHYKDSGVESSIVATNSKSL